MKFLIFVGSRFSLLGITKKATRKESQEKRGKGETDYWLL
jgi:hypothetical protein